MRTEVDVEGDLEALFYIRTQICLWLGVIFFSLFFLLDYVCCQSLFPLFLFYRLVFVSTLLVILGLLRLPAFRRHSRPLMYGAMLLGTMTISMMTVRLGGFTSGYYVGILLMIAGGFSVLPLSVQQALSIGLAMYLVYIVTVLLGCGGTVFLQWTEAVNNSFFFLSIVAVTTVQCFDDLRTQIKSLRSKKNIAAIRSELTMYTGNLEMLVSERVQQLEESRLRFRDLYNNILDMVVLLDGSGRIVMINHRCLAVLGRQPEEIHGSLFVSLLAQDAGEEVGLELIESLRRGDTIIGRQARMETAEGKIIEVEISGNQVEVQDGGGHFQLIIRDITRRKDMERQVLASDQLIDTSRQAAIFGLARLAECRDDDTGAHLSRIRAYTRILTEELAEHPEFAAHVSEAFKEDIYRSSVLHDIGKVGIPDAILLKPGKLSDAEFMVMRQHCEYGSASLSVTSGAGGDVSFLAMARDIVRYHHEWWDGTGYPEGLRGDAIPLAARIVALADVYDALTTSRAYKPAYNHEKAREIIIRESGSHFDPSVVNAFLLREQEFKATRMNLLLY